MSEVAVALARATGALAAAGIASPRTDAELLAAHVLGLPRGRLVLAEGFTPAQLSRFEELVRERASRVPLQHLTGSAGFGQLDLAVGPGVFIPRPETELLAQWALASVASGCSGAEPAVKRPETGGTQPARVVVDLCSGTGALALAIAHGRPAALVYAVERSPAALVWLRRNAADRARAGDRPVAVVAGDAADPAVLAQLDGTVDLVVCNPPYVPETREPGSPRLPPEVLGHDPPEAVFAGPDGLAVIRPVIARAAALLRPGGRLGLEHDETHAQAVPALLRDGPFDQVADHRDLTGRPRHATAVRVAD